MTRAPDVLERLAAANPVDPAAPVRPPSSRASRRSSAPGAPGRAARRRRAPRLALAGAGLALAALVAVLVTTLPGAGVAPARAAYVAFSAPTGVFHAVEEVALRQPGRPATHAWIESWTAARGGRSHVLQYDVRPDGRRGRLVAETFGERTVGYAVPRDGGPLGLASLESPGATDPRVAYLEAYGEGRVRDAGTATARIAGRVHRAWRLVAEHRVGPSLNQVDGRSVRVPGYVEREVFVVDVRTRALLLARSTGLTGTQRGFHRQTVIRRFLRFERLPGRAGLRRTPRFQRSCRDREVRSQAAGCIVVRRHGRQGARRLPRN